MKILSIKLPPELDRQVRAAARRRRVPVSTVVRESLAEYVTKDAPPQPGSFLEVAGDLIGCVEEGPPDLSSSAAHLRGYGDPNRPRRRGPRRR